MSDNLMLKILDDSCLEVLLWEGHTTTIGCLSGRVLMLGCHNPFMRCLWFQAYQAHLHHDCLQGERENVAQCFYCSRNGDDRLFSELAAVFSRDALLEIESDEEYVE